MPDITPLKVIRTAGDTTALSEFNTDDTVPITSGGTGATTVEQARINLGIGSGDLNIDGGSANSIYTAPQLIDGGSA